MKSLHKDFSGITQFDQQVLCDLVEFFNLDFLLKNLGDYELWFRNLSVLAQQNLGLAHCVIHNQAAHNVASIAVKHIPNFKYLYPDRIGAYSFPRSHVDTLTLTGTRLSGKKFWASNLDVADYIILRILDPNKIEKWIYLDLQKINHRMVTNNFNPLGMKVARAFDIEIADDIPAEWILDNYVPKEELHTIVNFHKYGLITNYWSASKALLAHIEKIANERKYSLEYEIEKLRLQVNMLEIVWQKNMASLLAERNKEFWHVRDTQHNFGKKTLIDIINLFMQLQNSRLCDQNSLESQVFRDAVVFASHIENLYTNVTAKWNN